MALGPLAYRAQQSRRQATASVRNPENRRANRARAATASPGNPENTAGKGRPSSPSRNTRSTPSPGPPPSPGSSRREIDIPNIPLEDAQYLAQIASINRALSDFETQAATRASRYGTDYLTGVRQMGYRPSEEFAAMPDVLQLATRMAEPEQETVAARAATADTAEEAPAIAPVAGQWDIEGRFSPYSAAARGTRSLRDEFAARGTLRSSDFGRTFGEFQNRLQEQLNAMETARTRFGEDLATDIMQQRTEAEERRQSARRQAASRQAAARAQAIMEALAG